MKKQQRNRSTKPKFSDQYSNNNKKSMVDPFNEPMPSKVKIVEFAKKDILKTTLIVRRWIAQK